MSSFDKTMQFNFQDEPAETNVHEVLFTVYDALQEKATTRLTKSLGICYQETLLTFLVITMRETQFAS